MDLRRVVITGMGAVSPFGRGTDILIDSLLANESAVTEAPELLEIEGIRTRVAAKVKGVDPKEIPRKFRRSMSNMSVYATFAASEAVSRASVPAEALAGGRLGVAIGSTIGSPMASHGFYKDFLSGHTLENVRSTLFFQIMNHSAASNVVQALGITGRTLAPASACSTSTQAIGYAYEMIAFGKQDMMIAGGADEYHPLSSATFDIINAASTGYNDRPSMTPRPFDLNRDGVVCAEGAGILLLETLESALSRGVPVLAEVIGFSTTSDPANIADPHAHSIESCIRIALADAGIEANEVDYVNAHATGTVQGDIAESEAIARVFGSNVPVSSLKGHLGHTVAASGSLETIATVGMMSRNVIIPTRNLDMVDPMCGNVRHVRVREEVDGIRVAVKNNFALGGVNSCIVLRRY